MRFTCEISINFAESAHAPGEGRKAAGKIVKP
jgi:hypothetical protein